MKNLKRTISFLFIFFTLVSSSLHSQSKVPNLQDLIGSKGSSAEYEMGKRGYKHINTSKTDYDSYSNWWHETAKKCVTVRVSNGRVKSAVYAPDFDCKKSNNKYSKSTKKHHDYNSYDNKYYKNNNHSTTYVIRSSESGLVLDANMHSSEAVSVYRQHGGANQKWTIKHLGGDEVSIINVANGKALTVNSSSIVSLQPWRNSTNQKWYLERLSSNEYIIVSKANSKVLDVSSGSHNMTTFKRNGTAHQKWILEKTY